MTEQEERNYKESLSQLEPEVLQQVLGGLRDDFSYFQGVLSQMESDQSQSYASIAEIVKYLVDTNKRISIVSDALGLNAPKGPSHIAVDITRKVATSEGIKNVRCSLSYDLAINGEHDEKTLQDYYARAYNETGALVFSKGEKTKVSNIATAIQRVTGLDYATDFDILNYRVTADEVLAQGDEKGV